MHRERFAPSPTGLLHLGHAFSAITASEAACAENGEFLLRIEDIDQSRCKQDYVDAIFDDLRWLGLIWPKPVLFQSTRLPAFRLALAQLERLGVIYHCTCTRGDIKQALAASQEGTERAGVYPGTCRDRNIQPEQPAAIRLDMVRAVALIEPEVLSFTELGEGPSGETGQIHISVQELIQNYGDIVLARKDIGTSYHLSVVIDDAHQQISHVTRGRDLFDDTKVHVALQKLLGLTTPLYRHHRLIRDEHGKRLAKRDDAKSIARYRQDGASPQDIRALIGL